jgi:hypothetical protein
LFFFTTVPHRPIATETPFEHTKKHRDFSVHIVVYLRFRLAGIEALKTTGILESEFLSMTPAWR